MSLHLKPERMVAGMQCVPALVILMFAACTDSTPPVPDGQGTKAHWKPDDSGVYVVHWEGGITLDTAHFYLGETHAGKGLPGFDRVMNALGEIRPDARVRFTAPASILYLCDETYSTSDLLPFGNDHAGRKRFGELMPETDMKLDRKGAAPREDRGEVSADGLEYRICGYVFRPSRIKLTVREGEGERGQYIKLDQTVPEGELGWYVGTLEIPEKWQISGLAFEGLAVVFRNQHSESFRLMPYENEVLSHELSGVKDDATIGSLLRKYALQREEANKSSRTKP